MADDEEHANGVSEKDNGDVENLSQADEVPEDQPVNVDHGNDEHVQAATADAGGSEEEPEASEKQPTEAPDDEREEEQQRAEEAGSQDHHDDGDSEVVKEEEEGEAEVKDEDQGVDDTHSVSERGEDVLQDPARSESRTTVGEEIEEGGGEQDGELKEKDSRASTVDKTLLHLSGESTERRDSQKKVKIAGFTEDTKQSISATLCERLSSTNLEDDEVEIEKEEVPFEDYQTEPAVAQSSEMPKDFDRDDIAHNYQEAVVVRRLLRMRDGYLQHKLGDYFSKRKRSAEQHVHDKNVPDPAQIFLKYLSQFEDLGTKYANDKERATAQVLLIKDMALERKKVVDAQRMRFMDYKKQVALNAVGRQSGKPMHPKDVEMAIVREELKEQDLIQIRLENIKLKYTLRKANQELKRREEFADGLHLFDFELLKIENETCNEKIEERNEELHKLRKKNSSTIQILTHLKEKLKSVQRENLAKKASLKEAESGVAHSRQILSRAKHSRDFLRKDNRKLRYQSGLMVHDGTLRDLEQTMDEKHELISKLSELQMKHKSLTDQCVRIKQNIERTKHRNNCLYNSNCNSLKKKK